MFQAILIAHVLIAMISLLHLGYFSLTVVKKTHAKKQTTIVLLNSLLTTCSGLGLLAAGGSLSRTCISLSAYGAAALLALHAGNQTGYTDRQLQRDKARPSLPR